jgi:8-amino-7-oxononanoate synthase
MSQTNLPDHLERALKEREENGSMRQLAKKNPEIDFCSNDYLGFSTTDILDSAILVNDTLGMIKKSGSTGSRLISGNSDFTEQVEKQIAQFHNAEAALIFNSGYDANLGFFSAVPQKNDLILYDELVHASIHDGIRLSHASRYKFTHNSMEDLMDLIRRHNASHPNIYIAVESVYSMDGDIAPLKELAEIVRTRENIFLIVDEAHALGVFGEKGRGLCNAMNVEKFCFARLYTYGKAMGCHGAALVGSDVLRKFLINFSRPFIYTTGLPAHSIEAISTSYKLLEENDTARVNLAENINYFIKQAASIPLVITNKSAIQYFVAGSNSSAERLETSLAKKGIFAKAIKNPTVKEGTERVRFCIHAFNTHEEIDKLLETIRTF